MPARHDGTGPVRHDIRVNGVRLRYDEYGQPDDPDVLQLHALGLSGDDWAGVSARLAPNHHVIAPDMRGHAHSEWPGTYSFELMRDDVMALAELLSLHDATLVGHSMGGTVAWLAAEERPAWLSRLVIEDAPPPSGGDHMPLGRRPEGELPFDWAVIESIVGQIDSPDPRWWSKLDRIDAPTVVVQGGPASHVPQQKLLDAAAAVRDCTLVEVPVGHHIHRVRPDEFLAAWLACHAPSRDTFYSNER